MQGHWQVRSVTLEHSLTEELHVMHDLDGQEMLRFLIPKNTRRKVTECLLRAFYRLLRQDVNFPVKQNLNSHIS